MKKRLTTNAVIRFLNDHPQVFVIRTNTKRGEPLYCFSDTLRVIDQTVGDRLIEKSILVDRGDALPVLGAAGQSYVLSDRWRA
ncbi:hypothetical protein [Xanthobacter versatilis]|uniref:hypothetical protein n=1 Tax=Xanthobacter autotrophicus (strain ATCC BAA-1158 / Py2) TaxID=78245 RepID=UPI00372B590D